MDGILNNVNDGADILSNVNGGVAVALCVVAVLICVVALFSGIISIWLGFAYYKYNRLENSAGLTGEEAARMILDRCGLENIKVKVTGSLMFGNSYSHYFKKVRIRRMTRNKASLTALAMGSQKAALAVLDKENDGDMEKRIKITPIIYFGPLAFIPLVAIGAAIDVVLFNSAGFATMAVSLLALAFYALSVVFSVMTLKTEKKAQERTYELLKENQMATDEEILSLHKLFRLYNIQYINNIIISVLELIYYALRIFAMFSNNSSSSSSNN